MSRYRTILLAVMAVLAFSGCALLFPMSISSSGEASPVVVQATTTP